MGRPKGIPASKRQSEAGAANLKKYQAERGHGLQALSHGAYSNTIRKRYSDKRTSEGKKLQVVIDSIISDLGGADQINSAQNVLLAGLRGKFIVIFQISDFLDRQRSIVCEDGSILPILGNSYLQYTESIRRDLESIFAMGRSTLRRKVPSISDIISGSK